MKFILAQKVGRCARRNRTRPDGTAGEGRVLSILHHPVDRVIWH